MRLGGGVAHEVGEEPFDDPVLAHDPLRPLEARLGEDGLLARAAGSSRRRVRSMS